MNNQSNNSNPSGNQPPPLNTSKLFMFWVVLLAVLTWVTQHLLDEENNVNLNVETVVNSNGGTEVIINQNASGHYLARGTINNHSVIFLLDTGATNVAIPENIAKQIGLKKGFKTTAQTANGRTDIFLTRLNSISVGDIELNNVRASINPGLQSPEILLGMSFLKHLQMTQESGILRLSVPD